MKLIVNRIFCAGLILFPFLSFSQDDMMQMLEDETSKELGAVKVFATFKGGKIINAQSVETVKKKTLDFRIGHRFGNVVNQHSGNGGFHEFFGFDNASDIRFSFDYGITDNLQIGYGRSKQNEIWDGSIKYKILHQTEDNSTPVSLVWYSDIGFTSKKDPDSLYENTAHRFSYVHQLIIARKFAPWLSVEILPTYVHRNVVTRYVNNEGNEEENSNFAIGFAGRVKVTKRLSLVADYFLTFSKYRSVTPDTRDPNKNYYAPVGLGVEIETGGHVFTINLTNSSAILENSYLINTADSWSTGAFKLGFLISRVFNF